MGCHLEEVGEMLEEVIATTPEAVEALEGALIALEKLSNLMKKKESAIIVSFRHRQALLDALADQIVTATGVGTFLGMDVPGALKEVNRSNYSKFENGEPIFNENKKVMKGKDYTPPDLSKFI